jgi:hypothetical protein
VGDAWAFVQDGQRITVAEGVPLGLAATFGLGTAAQAVSLVQGLAGMTGIGNAHRFQQYFRDVHTINQHAFVSTSRYESLGQLLLGRPCDWPFYFQ